MVLYTYLQPNTCLQTITCLQPDACSQLILGPFIYPSVPVGLGAPIRRVVALSCLRVNNTGSTAMARVVTVHSAQSWFFSVSWLVVVK